MFGFGKPRPKRRLPPANRRIYERVIANYAVSAWGENKMLRANLLNLSFRGALLETDIALERGALLTFTLRCEHGSGATTARVVRQSTRGLAIAFVQPTDDFLAVLVESIVPNLTAPLA